MSGANKPECDLAALKAATRKAAFARRKEAHVSQPDAPEQAAQQFLTHIDPSASTVIAGYRPIRTELDPTPLMVRLHHQGHRLAVPVIEAAGAPLAFREWSPETEMTTGAFGAEIPAAGAWLEPDLLIVPLVAWDRSGGRLGYGGGFYDRTLERLRSRHPTRAIAFAYAAQEVPAVPLEPTDQRLDAICTEVGFTRVPANA
ncbi:MAG: 5-formyltetrahydrofolate cyclo-ligase [Pseudomonadota bacterium]